MKKFMLFLANLAFAANIFSQPFHPRKAMKDETVVWKNKERALKIIGLSMIGMGAFMFAKAPSDNSNDGSGGGYLLLGGISFTVAAIPLMIRSHGYHKKLAQADLSFSTSTTPCFPKTVAIRPNIQPGLLLSIPINRK